MPSFEFVSLIAVTERYVAHVWRYWWRRNDNSDHKYFAVTLRYDRVEFRCQLSTRISLWMNNDTAYVMYLNCLESAWLLSLDPYEMFIVSLVFIPTRIGTWHHHADMWHHFWHHKSTGRSVGSPELCVFVKAVSLTQTFQRVSTL